MMDDIVDIMNGTGLTNNNEIRNNGVTYEFLPMLIRCYELHISPVKKIGEYPPFQYHRDHENAKDGETCRPETMSLRNICS